MQKRQNAYLVVDAGNTNIKICQVIGSEIEPMEVISTLDEALVRVKGQHLVLTSVLDAATKDKLQEECKSVYEINHEHKLPYDSAYQSMNTVGIDRLCNVAGVLKYAKNKNGLSIDIGTCIKFDFITADKVYKGGSIAPGIRLRFQSLNDYTSNLPLLNETGHSTLIGNNTEKSMISGVLNGMNSEITGMIARYEAEYGPIDIYLTGGDALYFDIPQKNNIFAVKNLTILGAVEIYNLNAL